MVLSFKQSAFLTLIVAIIALFVWVNQEKETPFPEEGVVTYEQLDEIIEIAERNDEDKDAILDEIIAKVNEIKQDIKTEYELQKELHDEKKDENFNEQQF